MEGFLDVEGRERREGKGYKKWFVQGWIIYFVKNPFKDPLDIMLSFNF